MKTAALKTLGCKLNQYETEALREALEAAGYAVVDFADDADLYVINTCTVTARSDYKSRQLVRSALKRNPDARLVVTGCAAHLDPERFAAEGDRITVVDNEDKPRVLELLGEGGPAGDVSYFRDKTRFFLKVQEGCDHDCAYCRVVLARGAARSREAAEVVGEVARAVDSGVKEIVLTGVNVGGYGVDLGGPGLGALVEEIVKLPGDFRVRLSSVDPSDLDDILIELVAGHSRVCPHVHLPLQSGDDGVLAAMRRRYNVAEYKTVCERLLELNGSAAVGGDVMAGLPGEDDAAFENTLALVEEIPFAYLHVFPYSPRPGTDAAAMPNQVMPEVRTERAAVLRAAAARKKEAFTARNVGTTRETLIEEAVDKETGHHVGITDNYLHLLVRDAAGRENTFADLVVAEGEGRLYGTEPEG
ncbi:MAG: tRNA (N(6)-L-threonylcarbamoyladenosine(37)-C(2))-methylthiotransferase MtaB [Candidatus Coatesbacteria bacterium]|nr:MAG: tRNA (N(6)-L-threonylcarbamoyladenosine(37)-C(2))-methylthiotransferase MtaB [Candidatus Coatesbacteria bacterium]